MKNTPVDERKAISREEVFNSVTHGIGLILAAAGLVVLIVKANRSHLIALMIYGVTLVLLYLASTLYHIIPQSKIKMVFRVLDHIGIFLLIGGTYTPFCVIALKGSIGFTLLAIVWLLTLAGLIFKIFLTGRYDILSLLLYLALGWMVIIVLKPVYHSVPFTSFIFLMIGGFSYSLGLIFYRMPKLRYHHGIWHIFVMGGSGAHFVSVLLLTSS